MYIGIVIVFISRFVKVKLIRSMFVCMCLSFEFLRNMVMERELLMMMSKDR